MEDTIFYAIIVASFLIILVLCIIGIIIFKYITRVGNVLVDNQEELSRQINKENSKSLAWHERGMIDPKKQ